MEGSYPQNGYVALGEVVFVVMEVTTWNNKVNMSFTALRWKLKHWTEGKSCGIIYFEFGSYATLEIFCEWRGYNGTVVSAQPIRRVDVWALGHFSASVEYYF